VVSALGIRGRPSRALCGDRGHLGQRHLPAEVIDEPDVHRPVRPPYPAQHAGASAPGASLLTAGLADIRAELETHFFGTLAVVRAFAPQLARHDESAILNVLSVLSWLSVPGSGAYCAAKSAEWSLTNALRQELAPQGTRVSALHVGYMDTDMARNVDAPKSDPAVIAKLAIDGIEAGDAEIIADEISQRVRAGLSGGVTALYPQVA
jgi:NAD(P)-dependent dehydrogenase (short-subunit alcohol dehydrogenase family)